MLIMILTNSHDVIEVWVLKVWVLVLATRFQVLNFTKSNRCRAPSEVARTSPLFTSPFAKGGRKKRLFASRQTASAKTGRTALKSRDRFREKRTAALKI